MKGPVPQPVFATVPRSWAGQTVVCIGSGPSLTPEDVALACSHGPVIGVNDAYRLIPADKSDAALLACDHGWWRVHEGVPSFTGQKYGLDPRSAKYGVQILKNTGREGLETDPSGVRTGDNSGYQAVNVAVHYGAARILLLGYDMQRSGGRSHWFGEHPQGLQRPPVSSFVPFFAGLATAAQALGVEIVNCSRATALTCFPCTTLDRALSVTVAA